MRTFGYELVVDCDKCDLEAVQSLDNIKKFVDDVLVKTEMKKMSDMYSCYLEDTPENREKGIVGWSICQFIQTSSLTMHLCENLERGYGTVYLNFFSCKEFDKDDVIELLKVYFGARIRNVNCLRRDATSSDFIFRSQCQ